MLLLQSKRLPLPLGEDERLRLLDALAAKHPKPLVRTTRRAALRLLLQGLDEAALASASARLERECAAEGPHTPGELFCENDCVLSLVFGDGAEGGVEAFVVYGVETAAPLAKLERFCAEVREAASGIEAEERREVENASALPSWEARAGRSSQGLARFIAVQPLEVVRAGAALRGGRQLARASELLEQQPVRHFLRRVQEMRREGFTPRRLLKEAGALSGVSVEKMMEAGLLERELRVSCRKSGHALFDLPSPDSLAAVTISKAKCSQCAAPVADEVIEETVNPTRLAVSLLEDGGWLTNRVYKIVRSLGVPDSEIATGPVSPHGESSLAVDVCGSSFLFVTKDGDLTPAFCRRAAETIEETEADHVVVVVTGAVEDEGRLRLYEFAWRRARAGHDLATTVVEGLSGAREQIERAFRGAVRRELSRALHTLDRGLGFSATTFVLDWFKLAKAARAARDEATPGASPFVGLDHKVAS
ncbi:MAG TPA: hypothetical protein VGX48_21560 [Pyrinomonadaceae bacterium]|jgi:hypothetical protein|nr:hypothetical protein [Pyrinomonadaceae bacterium]